MIFKLMTLSIILSSLTSLSCDQQNSNSSSNTIKDSAIMKTDAIKEEPVSYTVNGKNYDGYVTYDSIQVGKRPAILIVHEWWGLTDYPRMRAKKLAELGYIAMAVDMYGDGQIAPDPKAAMAFASPFYK